MSLRHLPPFHPSRRQALQALVASFAGWGMSGWLPALADSTAGEKKGRHCILMWMNGGPSQTDTFDPKPGHPNGDSFRRSPPKRRCADQRAPSAPRRARSAPGDSAGLSTREGDHGRGTFAMHTGRQPDPLVRFSTLGSLISRNW